MTIITQKTVFYIGRIEHLPRHFCFEPQDCFVFGNDAQHMANKGTHQQSTSETSVNTVPEHRESIAMFAGKSAKC